MPLSYIARGTFRDGSKYIRFPQAPPSQRTTLFLSYPDGSAGKARDGQVSEYFPAGSFQAELVHGALADFEAGRGCQDFQRSLFQS